MKTNGMKKQGSQEQGGRLGVERCREEKSQQTPAVVREVVCGVCSRSFRRESDRMRHKCVDERRKLVWEQKGAVQCLLCQKWFRSKGGITIHRYVPER